jgi:hypothetical protein
VELQHQDLRPEVNDWLFDSPGPAGPGDGQRTGLDDPVEEWLRRYETATVLAG